MELVLGPCKSGHCVGAEGYVACVNLCPLLFCWSMCLTHLEGEPSHDYVDYVVAILKEKEMQMN